MEAFKSIFRNGILMAIIAHGLIGISLLWDKVLLNKPESKNLLSYVFWLSAISVFGLVLIPFGFKMPDWKLAAIAFGAGVLDLVASYFYYVALNQARLPKSWQQWEDSRQ